MSTRKLTAAIQHLLIQVQQFAKRLINRSVLWLFRNLMVLGKYPRLSKAGFVLPTTVLLLLVLLLTVGSIGYRTYTRTVQTIGERQQRVIYNAATPTLDRAKAKIEYLFDSRKDPRFPSGIPSEKWLLGMMLDYVGGTTIGTTTVPAHPTRTATYDPYVLPGETRVDLDGNGQLDNAWVYDADTDGDGVNDAKVAYSIIYKTPDNLTPATALANTSDEAIPGRASRLEVRHGPLSNSGQQDPACATSTASAATSDGVGRGWLPSSSETSQLRKNFQVDVYVQPNTPNRPVAALEFHQDRTVEQGNKWGAWFRNDLEIFPGPTFNWNGAMHSEGNVMIGGASFRSYLISSEFSCLNTTKEASEVTTVSIPDPTNPFTGEFIAGSLRSDTSGAGDRAEFDLFKGFGVGPGVFPGVPRLDSTNDSVPGTVVPSNHALDPVILQTEGRSAARGTVTSTPWAPVTNGPNERLKQPAQEAPPYVDDSYRADNRYGPKPRYGGREDDPAIDIPATSKIGDVIPAAGNERLVGNAPAAGQDNSAVGLDGYWERRARNEGVRLIVGQRLELGDAAGWGGPLGSDRTKVLDSEPLRPWESCTAPVNRSGRCNEARQRRSLWDNLPAVQAAAVYHKSATGGPDVPAACLASTVHPGTAGTLDRSATFENLAYGFAAANFTRYGVDSTSTSPLIISDFLRGRGTNGWEYNVPPATVFDSTTTPMMRALRNLAMLAGDPEGGAPSFTPVQNEIVHPYPTLAMWGDFSMLRRVLNDRMQIDGSGGETFDTLSPADKTTLYTSACMMGMLAYQVDYLEDFNPENHPLIGKSYPTLSNWAATEPNLFYAGLRGAIRAIQSGGTPLGPIPNLNTYVGLNPETYVRLLERWRDYVAANGGSYTSPAAGATLIYTTDQLNQIILLAQMIISKEQVARDRQLGFYGSGFAAASPGNAAYSETSVGGRYGSGLLSCRGMQTAAIDDSIKFLCSNRPFYPVLYNLFPAPDTIGSGTHPDADGLAGVGGRTYARDDVSTAELQYLVNNSGNAGKFFEPVSPAAIALTPKAQASWSLPYAVLAVAPAGSDTELTPNNNRDNLIKVCLSGPCLRNSAGVSGTGEFWRVGFKDSAFYNGREAMSVRAMDLHLDLLRTTAIGTDFWLPNAGIVYAYREDAVSELGIVRPTLGDWATCSNESALRTNADCRMNTTSSAVLSKDPPLNDSNNITPKPVDYFPDPDRRPHGFRLRRGAVLTRAGDNGRGLSFISDNPVYIQGDFNLHQTSDGLRLEEFQTLLDYYDNGPQKGRYTNFYGRPLSDLDTRFARPTTDQWRPSEVLSDAIHILSDNFCDGSIQDAFLTVGVGSTATLANANNPSVTSARYGCQGNINRSSYLAAGRPKDGGTGALPVLDPVYRPGVRWTRTNLADNNVTSTTAGVLAPFVEGDSPIVVSKQGNPWKDGINFNAGRNYGGDYYTFAEQKSLILAQSDTRVNSIIISGLVPSRSKQSYGGLHNFPRFLESWKATQGGDDIPLFISGSLLQLSFSGQATGPYDQDAWEVGSAVADDEYNQYYDPPLRRWGYDVGLQYAPAGPIAQRFVTVRSIRSEFYSEPPANDPYIQNLCRAIPSNPRPCT